MTGSRFDIYKFYKDGTATWLGPANDLQEVNARAFEMPPEAGCKFCVLDQKDGTINTYGPEDFPVRPLIPPTSR